MYNLKHLNPFIDANQKIGYLATDYAYCKFGNLQENFIFPNSIERHFCLVKNLPFGHDLPTSSVNDKVISPFCKGFIFTKLQGVS